MAVAQGLLPCFAGEGYVSSGENSPAPLFLCALSVSGLPTKVASCLVVTITARTVGAAEPKPVALLATPSAGKTVVRGLLRVLERPEQTALLLVQRPKALSCRMTSSDLIKQQLRLLYCTVSCFCRPGSKVCSHRVASQCAAEHCGGCSSGRLDRRCVLLSQGGCVLRGTRLLLQPCCSGGNLLPCIG